MSKYDAEIIKMLQADKGTFLTSTTIAQRLGITKRTVMNSIKDINAKTINITIQYGNKSLTFKYEYNALKRDLTNDSKGSSGYGKAYEEVSHFIKENSHVNLSRWTEEFNFSNITSITYGKNELYHYDLSLSNDKEAEEDLEIEI